MTTPLATVHPAAIVTAEPVAAAAMVRAALYAFLINRGVDATTVGAICGLCELVLAYLTRRNVTPSKRAEERVALALAQTPPGPGGEPPSSATAAIAAGSTPTPAPSAATS